MRIRWVCVSKTCQREVEEQMPPGEVAGKLPSPPCTCGAAMKRVYTAPTVRKLSEDEIHQLNETRLLQS